MEKKSFAEKIQEGYFSREEAREFVRVLEEVLDVVRTRLGVRVKVGTVRYRYSGVIRCRLEVERLGSQEIYEKRKEEEYKRYIFLVTGETGSVLYNSFGKKVVIDAHTLKIVGCKSSLRKYPIVLENADGKRFRVSIETLKKALS